MKKQAVLRQKFRCTDNYLENIKNAFELPGITENFVDKFWRKRYNELYISEGGGSLPIFQKWRFKLII